MPDGQLGVKPVDTGRDNGARGMKLMESYEIHGRSRNTLDMAGTELLLEYSPSNR